MPDPTPSDDPNLAAFERNFAAQLELVQAEEDADAGPRPRGGRFGGFLDGVIAKRVLGALVVALDQTYEGKLLEPFEVSEQLLATHRPDVDASAIKLMARLIRSGDDMIHSF